MRESGHAGQAVPDPAVLEFATGERRAVVTLNRRHFVRLHQERPDRYSLKLTIPGDTHAKLRRAQDLLRHAIPTGDLTQVFDRALTALLRELERKKLAATNRPRTATAPSSSRHSRYIPAAVRREVWARDGGRCAFVGPEGRCGETAFLEFHHLVPYADRGATEASNLQVRCRAHNQHEAEQWFGPMVVRETLARYSH
jgi:5-methylcytosine-specific restriction endonuclease McrA